MRHGTLAAISGSRIVGWQATGHPWLLSATCNLASFSLGLPSSPGGAQVEA